jgi:hypothetical protein
MCDTSIATHTAIVNDLNECGIRVVGLHEMTPDGHKSALNFHTMGNYYNTGFLGDRIISIHRHPALDDGLLLDRYKKILWQLWQDGKEYDWEGCLKNVPAFSFLKDKPEEFYCSELAEWLAGQCGFSYYRDKAEKDDNVMPNVLQKSKYLTKIA